MDLKNKSRDQLEKLWAAHRRKYNALVLNGGAVEAIRECERDIERIREELYLRNKKCNQPRQELYSNLYTLLAQLHITTGSNMLDGRKHINTPKP